MTERWEPGTEYSFGSVVEYEGHRYKIIQPHRSLGDWTPNVTPALWGKLPDIRPQEERSWQEDRKEERYEHEEREERSWQDEKREEKPWHEEHSQQVEVHNEEREKHWYDLDDHRKKQLEIGGGLAAGAALLAGGYYAYKHYAKKSEEEKKATAWSLQNWLHDAQERTEDFYRNGPRGPLTWVLVHGGNIPPNAIVGGEEGGRQLFIARAFYGGGIQVGKAGRHLEKGASIGFGHEEIPLETYEVLIGDPHAVRWVDTRGHLKPEKLDVRLVEGGREANGIPLYIAQALHNGVSPGKVSEKLDGAFIPYGGTEICIKEYRVLAYA